MAVERRASMSSLGTPRRYSLVSEAVPDRPHTRVDDEAPIEKKYAFGQVLGQGSFGVVREVTNRLTGERFAVKIVNKDKVSGFMRTHATLLAVVLPLPARSINPQPYLVWLLHLKEAVGVTASYK